MYLHWSAGNSTSVCSTTRAAVQRGLEGSGEQSKYSLTINLEKLITKSTWIMQKSGTRSSEAAD